MLTMVQASTDQGAILQFPLDDISDGYALEDITGLDPVKATLVSSSFAQMDGAQFHSSRREARNIVLTLGYEPDFVSTTVKSLRTRLYGFFMTEAKVNLRFFDSDGTYVDISGRVESFDSPQFTETPIATVSIMCFNPDFYDPSEVVVTGGTVSSTVDNVIDYYGDVDTGVTIELNVNRSLSEFTIYNLGSDGVQQSMLFAAPLVSGDVVRIVTIPGLKQVRLIRENLDTSALYSVSPNASWISMKPGSNQFRIYAEGASVPYTVTYTEKYGGL